jgi:hypothetical protein
MRECNNAIMLECMNEKKGKECGMRNDLKN